MRLLLDTHIFLWFITADARLSAAMQQAIRDSRNEVYLSVVSLWETIIKYQLGKLPLPDKPEHYIPEQRELHQIASLAVDERSVSYLPQLPALHRDPFDRMLICQALASDLTLMTRDDFMLAYPVPLFN
ncbi:MAG: type II toxin-antitoxin system VapC family toxin [Roseiflexaceae bacterium]